ncbi:HAMP domain-containing sensor histidine kinase [Ramlibacter sp. AN1133]|uniref:HAMP domain-containing sensor histidine kinase n=1 Tax=Ramlibacter sp. AN1133 TaxID=3133429 RepID=UPI0030C22FE9
MNLYRHFEAYHTYGRPRLKLIGVVGGLTYVSFYFLRFVRPNPDPLDDWPTRLVAIVLMAGLALQDYWPVRLRKYFLPFAYFAICYSLPFFCTFQALKRGGGLSMVSNLFMMVCFLTLLMDWRNLIASMLVGIGSAFVLFRLAYPELPIPYNVLDQSPAMVVIAIFGYIFKVSTEQVETERKLAARQAENERRIAALRDSMGFLAHELNTPLATVRLNVAGLQASLKGAEATSAPSGFVMMRERQPRELANVLERTERAALFCQAVVSSIVQTARDTFPKASSESVSAIGMLTALLRDYPFENGELQCVSVSPRVNFVIADARRDLLFLVLRTITKNALASLHGQQNPRLEIETGVRLTELGERGWIRFSDNGPGMAKDLLEKVSHEPVNSEDGGFGMGLLFCRRVLESFGASLDVTSEIDVGTKVVLEFTTEPSSTFESSPTPLR